MRQKSVSAESASERIVKNIHWATRKRHSPEEKIRIVLDGLWGEPVGHFGLSKLFEVRDGYVVSLYAQSCNNAAHQQLTNQPPKRSQVVVLNRACS